jgi:hypothetical protein
MGKPLTSFKGVPLPELPIPFEWKIVHNNSGSISIFDKSRNWYCYWAHSPGYQIYADKEGPDGLSVISTDYSEASLKEMIAFMHTAFLLGL